jgi:hypothetical protein
MDTDNDTVARVIAPWTDEQVARLWARQEDYGLHPYTCGYHSERSLEPTNGGWKCTAHECKFTQNWAHASDAMPEKS